MRWLLIFGMLLVVGCGTADIPLIGGSDCDHDEVAKNLDEIADRWDDAFAIAQSTSRIALSGPVGDLQEIRRETRRQDWPACAENAQQELIEMMDSIIDGFVAFMAQEDDTVVQAHMEDADSHRVAFRRALRDLRDD